MSTPRDWVYVREHPGLGGMSRFRTDIVIAIFYEKGDALATKIRLTGGVVYQVACPADIRQQLTVFEGPAGETMGDGGGIGVML